MSTAPSPTPPEDLHDRVRTWIEDDPDPRDRAELTALLSAAQTGDGPAGAELADRFSGPLEFGTAGLRGVVAAGEHRMNRAVVQRAAAGLGAWLTGRLERPRVVVGLDARRGSRAFADDSAAVLTAAGCEVLLLPRPLPTPLLAFAVRRFDADAGVMVTASHNPAADNGYKVYLGGRAAGPEGRGVQIVPPADAGIAAAIAAVGPLRDLPRATGGWTVLGEEVVEDYLAAVTGAVRPAPGRDPRVVVTPMHGVGGPVLLEALRRSGFDDVHVVAEQADPDPDFPTVPFPNPEEAGALDRAVALAERVGADVVLAVDPDADRCCVAVPDPASGGFTTLSGDDLGRVLGEELAAPGAVLACSVVSSQALAAVAARHGARFATALTGFKWIARVPELTFGYEEAIGYCVAPEVVRDKDGISASLLVAGIVRRELAAGRTLHDVLDDLDRADGVHLTAPVTVRVEDLSLIPAAMSRLRSQPPRELGGSPVTSVEDLADGVDDLPPTDGLRWRTADGTRVVVRPSGTEPKLKSYCEVVAGAGDDLAAARAAARERLAAVTRDVRAAVGIG
ncbi:phosphomannomutase [Kineococcus radiotolerans]|uniref:Phosphomannomutase n=1 Tax=Kineococcus radiotolerans TaxID=131568 RepID=A0A7W4XYI3_KINRA|nr:phospho-sugar mutase [Kineococcus radiotolerans]MBB2902265.1 phosphomannomutase [Kineococcus radiotolerans]